MKVALSVLCFHPGAHGVRQLMADVRGQFSGGIKSMTISVFVLFAAALSAIGLLLFGSGARLDRRICRAIRVRIATAVATSLLIPADIAFAIYDGTAADSRAIAVGLVTINIAAVGVIVAMVSAWRIKQAPARHPRRILAIGAHPDDLELACGGSLAKLHDSGHEIHALVMSAGERGGAGATRQQEAASGATFMGTTSVSVFAFPDTRLAEHERAMAELIESAVRRYNPDLIMTHSGNDQHQDHHAVYRATLRAARNHSTILSYESPSVTADFRPSVYIDIEDYVDAKVAAIGKHRDQAGKPYMTPMRVRGGAAFRGSQAKVAHAEAFEPVRVLGSSLGDL